MWELHWFFRKHLNRWLEPFSTLGVQCLRSASFHRHLNILIINYPALLGCGTLRVMRWGEGFFSIFWSHHNIYLTHWVRHHWGNDVRGWGEPVCYSQSHLYVLLELSGTLGVQHHWVISWMEPLRSFQSHLYVLLELSGTLGVWPHRMMRLMEPLHSFQSHLYVLLELSGPLGVWHNWVMTWRKTVFRATSMSC